MRNVATTDELWFTATHPSVSISPTGYIYPDPFSNASNEYVARYARS